MYMSNVSVDLTVSVEQITPGVSAEWLAVNTHNRKHRPKLVEKYARDMQANQWQANGSTIVFSKDGVLLDGQHRLMACVKSGTPFVSIVVRGVDVDAMRTVDSGAARTAGDAFNLEGEVNANALAAAVRFSWLWGNHGAMWTRVAPTHQELAAFLARWPETRTAVAIARANKDNSVAVPTSALAAFALNALRATGDEDMVRSFVSGIRTGSMDKEHPTFVLFRLFVNWGQQKGVHRKPAAYLALIVKCWNDCMTGSRRKTYMFKSLVEEFPEMLDINGELVDLAK